MSSSPFRPACNWWTQGGKRVFDGVTAFLALVVFAPLFLIVALAIRLTSPGPVFFSQIRVGRGGVPFRVYKFRSMRGDRTPDPQEIVPLAHPEVTAVGRWIRRLKVDELPQVLCVLKGTMSLIGPRPTLPDQVEHYDEFQRRRLLVRPGLTGLAQINGNAAIPWEERIRYDVYYVAHCGFPLDLTILVRTVAVIIGGETRMARPFVESPYGRREAE